MEGLDRERTPAELLGAFRLRFAPEDVANPDFRPRIEHFHAYVVGGCATLLFQLTEGTLPAILGASWREKELGVRNGMFCLAAADTSAPATPSRRRR